MRSGNTFSITLLLGLLTLLVLVPGIWEPTGLSGKDEYFLGLRTPMEMMARQEWLVPFLDGVPRIRKPPLMYWLGYGSYELFGVSLTSARMVTVLFSLLMVLSTVGVARRFLSRGGQACVAGGVLLACLGLHTESRRFMLDIPVAALSTAALWAWLVWREKGHALRLLPVTLLLAAGFMIKGPVVALVFLGGVLASRTLPSLPWSRSNSLLIGINLILLAALCAPWFLWVKSAYPEAVAIVMVDEVESRQFMTLTPGILFGLLNISLPWFFVFLSSIWQARKGAHNGRELLFWFAITFVPFLFLKSFDRYLLGSLVPLSMLVTQRLFWPEDRPCWAFRTGLVLSLLLGLGLSAFAVWFRLSSAAWMILPTLFLIWAWWYPAKRSVWLLLLAPMFYWLTLLSCVFPALGVGAIPNDVVRDATSRQVAFYDGPQPAMLAILSQQAHRHYPKLKANDFTQLGDTPIWTDEQGRSALLEDARQANVRLKLLRCFKTLASHGSGIRFVRPGTTRADWQTAFQTRSLDGLKTEICAYQQGQP